MASGQTDQCCTLPAAHHAAPAHPEESWMEPIEPSACSRHRWCSSTPTRKGTWSMRRVSVSIVWAAQCGLAPRAAPAAGGIDNATCGKQKTCMYVYTYVYMSIPTYIRQCQPRASHRRQQYQPQAGHRRRQLLYIETNQGDG